VNTFLTWWTLKLCIDVYLCFITGQQQLLVVISDIHCKNSLKVCIMSSCAISQSTYVLGSVQIYTDISYIYAVSKMELKYTEQNCGLLWMVGLTWGWIKDSLEIASQFMSLNITHPVLKLSRAGCCSLRHKYSRMQDPCSCLTHSPASSKFMETASQQFYTWHMLMTDKIGLVLYKYQRQFWNPHFLE
jgi:hypothetical protein